MTVRELVRKIDGYSLLRICEDEFEILFNESVFMFRNDIRYKYLLNREIKSINPIEEGINVILKAPTEEQIKLKEHVKSKWRDSKFWDEMFKAEYFRKRGKKNES